MKYFINHETEKKRAMLHDHHNDLHAYGGDLFNLFQAVSIFRHWLAVVVVVVGGGGGGGRGGVQASNRGYYFQACTLTNLKTFLVLLVAF